MLDLKLMDDEEKLLLLKLINREDVCGYFLYSYRNATQWTNHSCPGNMQLYLVHISLWHRVHFCSIGMA